VLTLQKLTMLTMPTTQTMLTLPDDLLVEAEVAQ
jgi:hypothetical protein